MNFKDGDRVVLCHITPELLAKGLRLGMAGRVREIPASLNGFSGAIGVEFEGHSDTGWNAGLQVTCINTRRDGKSIPVLSLCERLSL